MIRVLIGGAIGIALGFIYYKTIGCATGTCPITSNPWSSMLYGGVLGVLVTYK